MKCNQYCILSILGISFWFFLGFPFANYHESYEWIAQLNTHSLSEFIFGTTGHYSSYRPLGQAVAFLLYKASDDSLIPIQLFNYTTTIVSFFIFISAIEEKKILSVILTIVGGFFFIGFSYLFHLHGLYYSCLLLLISILILNSNKPFSYKNLAIVFTVSLIVSLFHPYAIIILIFYIVGLYIEKRDVMSFKHYILAISLILSGIVILKILVPNQTINWEVLGDKMLLNTYMPLNKNLLMVSTSTILSILTVESIVLAKKTKRSLIVIVIQLSLLLYYLSYPVIIIWFLVSVIKMLSLKRFAVVFLIFSTFFFPVFTGIETRHLYFPILILCAYTLPLNWVRFESKLKFINGNKILIVSLFVLSLLIVLKEGLNLPVLSNITRPLLIEKEKTYQLEEIIAWLVKSEYKDYNINLTSEFPDPSNKENNYSQRFPASNEYINNYLNSIRATNTERNTTREVLVCFNDCKIENAKLIHSIDGNFAGQASVYLQQ